MIFDTPIHTSLQSVNRVLSAGLPVVLVFARNGCAPCRQLDPTLNWLAGDYAGKLLFARIDADDEPELVGRYNVSQLPSLVFARQGQTVATAVGAAPESDLRRWCEYLALGGAQPPLPSGPAEPLRAAGIPAIPPSPSSSQADGKPIRLTDANFDQIIQGDKPVLVDFWAPWCGPCRMIAPTVEALAGEFAGRLVVGKLNVDENQRTASRYGVMSIPTLIVFRKGKVVDQVVGAVPGHILRQRVLPHLS